MKHKIAMVISAAVLLVTSVLSAQAQNKEDWKERIMSEKIAFLTAELNITPQEAQVFWPVYNQVNKEKDELMRKVFECYKDLSEAIKENKSAKETGVQLDKYLEALEKQRDAENAMPDKYKKVLPVDKVAKLYIAEEKFRRHQINRLHQGPQKGGEKPRQEKR